jgi:hypothetical protein
MRRRPIAPPGYHLVICRSFRHYRTGKIITAESCGKRCFAFVVKDR